MNGKHTEFWIRHAILLSVHNDPPWTMEGLRELLSDYNPTKPPRVVSTLLYQDYIKAGGSGVLSLTQKGKRALNALTKSESMFNTQVLPSIQELESTRDVLDELIRIRNISP